VLDNEHSLHFWKRHPCTSTVWRQLTGWREQVTTWRDLGGLLCSLSDMFFNPIQLYWIGTINKYFNMGWVTFRSPCTSQYKSNYRSEHAVTGEQNWKIWAVLRLRFPRCPLPFKYLLYERKHQLVIFHGWKKARITFHKPEKDPSLPENHRPTSKLIERLIPNIP
jgi:hypothetical protein